MTPKVARERALPRGKSSSVNRMKAPATKDAIRKGLSRKGMVAPLRGSPTGDKLINAFNQGINFGASGAEVEYVDGSYRLKAIPDPKAAPIDDGLAGNGEVKPG